MLDSVTTTGFGATGFFARDLRLAGAFFTGGFLDAVIVQTFRYREGHATAFRFPDGIESHE